MSKLVVVGSKNPVKIAAAKASFENVFPGVAFEFVGVSAPSGVSDQPMGDEETLEGAFNRLAHIVSHHPEAAYWVSMEGGCAHTAHGLEVFAWMVVQDETGKKGKARTASFCAPPAVATLVRSGHELGHADDIVFGQTNTKQKNGIVGLLTNDVIDRTTYYTHALILALIPCIKSEYYD